MSGNKSELPRQVTAAGAKRQRELARLKAERQAAKRRQQHTKAKRRNQVVGAIVGVAIVLAGLGYLLWPTSSTPTAAKPTPSASPSAKPSWALATTVTCGAPATVRTNVLHWPKAPVISVSATSKPVLTLTTNCGQIKIALTAAKAPKTVSSMVFLAAQGYFNNTKCHRLTTTGIFVIQCGDPTGTGSGGPGYTVPDENLPSVSGVNYPAGTVAMANSGPNTGGSQFFIVFANTTLGPNYTVWGKVTSGLDIAKYVANQGVTGGGTDGSPIQPLVISKASAT
ncbi:MAG: peptidylprolyl isomerase [Actinomycetes bacterium]